MFSLFVFNNSFNEYHGHMFFCFFFRFAWFSFKFANAQMIFLCAVAVCAFVICAFMWSCWDAASLGFSSSRTAWRWSTPAFPSSASEGTVNSWPRPAGTTACGYSGGRSCSRWRCWSTTQIWCKALPSLTTRTPGGGCWLLAPKTRGSACGLCSVRNQRRPEPLGFGQR